MSNVLIDVINDWVFNCTEIVELKMKMIKGRSICVSAVKKEKYEPENEAN